jgi:hypothetical protein
MTKKGRNMYEEVTCNSIIIKLTTSEFFTDSSNCLMHGKHVRYEDRG